jgi:hypothetical protein
MKRWLRTSLRSSFRRKWEEGDQMTREVSQATVQERQEAARSTVGFLQPRDSNAPLKPLLAKPATSVTPSCNQPTSDIGLWDGLLTNSDQSQDDDDEEEEGEGDTDEHFEPDEGASVLDDLDPGTCVQVSPDLDNGGATAQLATDRLPAVVNTDIERLRLHFMREWIALTGLQTSPRQCFLCNANVSSMPCPTEMTASKLCQHLEQNKHHGNRLKDYMDSCLNDDDRYHCRLCNKKVGKPMVGASDYTWKAIIRHSMIV